MIMAVEPVIVIIGVVILVSGMVAQPYLRRRAVQSGRALRKRRTGSTEPSTAGTYVGAAFFVAFGVYLLVFQTTDVTRGVPGWLSGGVLVVLSVVLVIRTFRRR
jgi:hypothetical protein